MAATRIILINTSVGAARQQIATLDRGVPGPLSAWQARRRQRVFELESRTVLTAKQPLSHQAVHAYLSRNAPVPFPRPHYPLWVHEGLAECGEAADAWPTASSTGRVHERHVARLNSLLELRRMIPMAKLVSGEDHPAGQQRFLRAPYWGLVHYLGQTGLIQDPSRREQFALVRGPARIAAFEQAVRQSLPEFEKGWHRHIRHLPR